MTVAELNPELRNLIDARLEAIEQILLRVQVSFTERRHIVGEVETQIFEMLSRRGDNPTRDDVIAVLDSLDSPESFVPEELRGRLAEAPAAPATPKGPRLSRMAVGSALLVILILLVGSLTMATSHGQDMAAIAIFWGFSLFAATVCGFGALVRVLRSNGRLRGLPFAAFAAFLSPLVLVNCLVIMVIVATQGVFPWLVTGAGILFLNYLGVRRLWRWLNERHGTIAESLRGDLTGWFARHNGIQPTA